MKAPQIIMIVLLSIGLLLSARYHGEDKEDTYNFWWTLASSAVTIGILVWGGFFK